MDFESDPPLFGPNALRGGLLAGTLAVVAAAIIEFFTDRAMDSFAASYGTGTAIMIALGGIAAMGLAGAYLGGKLDQRDTKKDREPSVERALSRALEPGIAPENARNQAWQQTVSADKPAGITKTR